MTRLIEKVIRGERQAVVEFYKSYSLRILRYLTRKLPRPEDAQEILHDVFLDALDGLPLLPDTRYVTPWLFTIAHNKVVDFYRKRKIKSILFSQLPLLQLISQEMHNPEFIYEKQRIREKIELSFKKLSGKHQLILRLRYEDGIRVKELAILLNLSFKATESLLFRARKGFQKEYGRT